MFSPIFKLIPCTCFGRIVRHPKSESRAQGRSHSAAFAAVPFYPVAPVARVLRAASLRRFAPRLYRIGKNPSRRRGR